MKRVLKAILLIVLGMAIMSLTANRSSSESTTTSGPVASYKSKRRPPSQDLSQPGENIETGGDYKAQKARKTDKPAGQKQSSSESARQSGPFKYLIDVNVSEQKVRIYENEQLLKEFLASTGKNNSTPLGDFVIENRGEWFFSEKYHQGGKWWVSFKGRGLYLFHSLPMDRNKNLLAEEAAKLGTPVSHGCIRLKEDHAKWVYDHVPEATPVHIHR